MAVPEGNDDQTGTRLELEQQMVTQPEFSHFDSQGSARMIDVSSKPATRRFARGSARICMQPETLSAILTNTGRKGDVIAVARLAGIMAAKRTADLIPLCHPLSLDAIELVFDAVDQQTLRVEASVYVEAKTGAEMEALTAASIAALTVYDMCKSADRAMVIQSIQLEEKSGGKSGTFVRQK